MSSQLELSAASSMLNSVGALGSVAITGTNAVLAPTGFYFFAVQPITDIVVASGVDVASATNANLSSLATISAGITVYGKWTSITLTSGVAVGYLARL